MDNIWITCRQRQNEPKWVLFCEQIWVELIQEKQKQVKMTNYHGTITHLPFSIKHQAETVSSWAVSLTKEQSSGSLTERRRKGTTWWSREARPWTWWARRQLAMLSISIWKTANKEQANRTEQWAKRQFHGQVMFRVTNQRLTHSGNLAM